MKNLDPDVQPKLIQIGAKLRELRKSTGLNYVAFSKKYRLNKMTLYRIECGREFTMGSLIKILKILKIENLSTFFQDL
jgi:transcriptional regulator with XRE-family HTH domain